MYAVVKIAGRQFKVAPQEKVTLPSLPDKPGSPVTFDNVLLVGDEGKITVGSPTVKGAKVQGKVLEHGREDTVTVFKKKRRKGYKVKRGHRQGYTLVEITNVAG